MKLLLALVCFFFAMSYSAYSAAAPQTFPTSAGEVKTTRLYHASTLIEAGGKTIYLDPAKPAKLAGYPKADLILITHVHPDHMDPASIAEISKSGQTSWRRPPWWQRSRLPSRLLMVKLKRGRAGPLRLSPPITSTQLTVPPQANCSM